MLSHWNQLSSLNQCDASRAKICPNVPHVMMPTVHIICQKCIRKTVFACLNPTFQYMGNVAAKPKRKCDLFQKKMIKGEETVLNCLLVESRTTDLVQAITSNNKTFEKLLCDLIPS